MEVPNDKVGVLIGKGGDTIRYLQYNSGAKIQITRDADANPQSTTRPVEIIGTLSNIKKAEKLINAVIAEVGLIISRGGDAIKALRAKSGARIQLIPQHLPEGDGAKERTVRVTGDRKQIEMAREMIKDVTNQDLMSCTHAPLVFQVGNMLECVLCFQHLVIHGFTLISGISLNILLLKRVDLA
ncbi:hypothetical protein GH714_012843 [Hevea brasiliensis]|uniref:K Homology domain-containing protein n=1 Tax=Hevea brasiliensis TaxID=3981 RepID=A0A6A6KQP7_HEVBR|nr:hypothetical protein GH714_012843 [Hevea brasiliensis]